MTITTRNIVENHCLVCNKIATPENFGRIFRLQNNAVFVCTEHTDCFALGLMLGQSELNAKVVELMGNVADDDSGWDLKNKVYDIVPHSRIQVLERARISNLRDRTPKDIYQALDGTVVGQEYAKKYVSLAVYKHLRAIKSAQPKSVVPDKHNVLLLGPSGCGKTLIAHTVAQELELPFVSVDATAFSPVGWQGSDADSIVGDVLEAAHRVVHVAERGVIFLDELDKLATSNAPGNKEGLSMSNQAALLRLIEGRVVKTPPAPQAAMMQIEQSSVDTARMMWFFGGAFPGLAEIVGRLMGFSGKSIGFRSQEGENLEAAIQNFEILQKASMDVLARALEEYGIGAELVGRIPTIVPLAPLNRDQLEMCLCGLDHSPIARESRMFAVCGYNLEFTDEAVGAILDMALKMVTGTRSLNSIVKSMTVQASYDLLGAPATKEQGRIIIDKECLTDPTKYRLEKKRGRKKLITDLTTSLAM